MKVVDRLLRSELFQSYQEIFQASTGLPLELHAVDDEEVTACRGSVNQNRFCSLLNKGDSGCQECLVAQKCLSNPESRGVQSIACFAGLQETAVPVAVDSQVVAQLKTGQVFHEEPKKSDFRKVTNILGEDSVDAVEIEEAYMATPVFEKQRYQAMVTLLAAFSLQLTKLANRIAKEQVNEEEGVIEMAKDYIEENLNDAIHLDEIAEEMGMSSFHFCRKFKESTGVTLTSYVSQRRVELAKEALENTDDKITDISFDVGFQSLSQFNRTFHKVTGMNPTAFRKKVA